MKEYINRKVPIQKYITMKKGFFFLFDNIYSS